MTQSKQDLIQLSLGSEARFFNEWVAGDLEHTNGRTVPFCPCLGSQLHEVYQDWCRKQGEFRTLSQNQFLSFIRKQPGWTAGEAQATWKTLHDRKKHSRKMVIPSESALAAHPGGTLARENYTTKQEWLTACYFAFAAIVEANP